MGEASDKTAESRPKRTRIELLVRQSDGESFETREIPSAVAYLHSRPQRIPDADWEMARLPFAPQGVVTYALKNRRTEQIIQISETEKFLWEQMDGRTSLQEIATAYVLRYGAFDFDLIPNLIRKLQRAQLLTLTPTSRLRKALARHRRIPVAQMAESALTVLERINISSRNVQTVFRDAYRFGGFFLFTPAAVVLCAVLAVFGLVAGVRLWPDAEHVVSGFGKNPLMAVLSVKVLFLVTVAAHQMVHGLALVHYGRRVREFGFTFLHGFVPTFYVDVTDIFMGSRRARVVTAVSGAVVHLVLGSVWLFIALHAAPGSFLQAFAAASGIIQWQAFVVALYPFCFIEMDGYHVLVDVLGIPTLKQDAMQYVGSLLRGAGIRRFTRQEALYVGYVAVSAVSVAAFIAFNVWMIAHAS